MVDLNRETLFTKIVKREIPSSIIYEDDDILETPFIILPKDSMGEVM